MNKIILALCIMLCSFGANALTMKGFKGKINNLSNRDISDFKLTIEGNCTYETNKRISWFVGPSFEMAECGSKSESIQINADGSYEFETFKFKGKFLPFVSKHKKYVQIRIRLSVEGLGVVLSETIGEDEEVYGRTIDEIRNALKTITVFDTKETRIDIAKQSLKEWREKGISYLDIDLDLDFGRDPNISYFRYHERKLTPSTLNTKELLSIKRLENGTFPKQVTLPSQLIARLGNNPDEMTYSFYWKARSSQDDSISEWIDVTFDTEDLGQVFLQAGAID